MKRAALILFLVACFNVQCLFCEEAPKEMKKSGIVSAIDLPKTTLSIERIEDKKQFTFVVSKDMLSKFKVGQFVEVTYVKDEKGNRVASKVKVADKPAAADKNVPAEKPKKNESGIDDDIAPPENPADKK